MKIVTKQDLMVKARHLNGIDGMSNVLIKAGTVIHDLKEPKTGTFTALVPELGRRVEFINITAEAFEEVE